MKHYYTKSFDEWIKKASRGWPDGTPTLNTSNYFLCENESNFSIEKYINAFFINSQDMHKIGEKWKDILNSYNVIQFNNSTKQVYALMTQVISVMNCVKGHTFVFTEEHIDDTMFAIFLEYAIQTGNHVVYARNQDEVWRAYLKYNNGVGETYFIMDLR